MSEIFFKFRYKIDHFKINKRQKLSRFEFCNFVNFYLNEFLLHVKSKCFFFTFNIKDSINSHIFIILRYFLQSNLIILDILYR